MEVTTEQQAALRKIAERINVGLQDLLALGDEVLGLLLAPDAGHELLDDEWYGPEGDPEPECPFYSADVRLHPRTGEPFAVAHGYATKLNVLLPNTEETRAVDFRSEPLLIGGRAVLSGYGSVLCLGQHRTRRNMPDGPATKYLTFQQRGWLHEPELHMSNEEVRRRIGDEIDAGTLILLPQRG